MSAAGGPASLSVPLREIGPCLEGVVPSTIATCSPEGEPNIAFLSIVRYVDDSHVALSRQFFNRTGRNLAGNPYAQVQVVHPATGEQFRLDVVFERTETEGTLFESMRTRLAAIASMTGMADRFRLRGADVFRVVECRRVGTGLSPARSVATPARDLEAFSRIAARMSACGDLSELFRVCLDALAGALACEHAMLLLLDETGEALYTVASHGYERSGVGSEVALGAGAAGVAAQRRSPVRITNMTRERVFTEATRIAMTPEDDDRAQRHIPLPGLPGVQSQLALPLVFQERLLGVLLLESVDAGRFLTPEEQLGTAIAGHLAACMRALRDREPADEPASPQGAAGHPAPGGSPVAIRHYPEDDSIFVDNDYLIKGVAGRILHRLLCAYVNERRAEFSNKELRLDPVVNLPDGRDNLEARLVLLRRRLAERCPSIRLVGMGRGRFRLELERPPILDEIAP